MTIQNFVILFFYWEVFIDMSKTTIRVYDIIPTQEIMTKETLELSGEIFENLKSLPFTHQGDIVCLEMSHDCLFSFVVFVADQSIKKLNKKYDK